ncbi:carboxypeptidase regulatory-like domain-containing protein [Lacinutrix sp. 5H-3-7-4]|uniref:carboxypeptidase regulatory-like domain-containing protein n=1 Tax=Lacinutrix sp. (strain 5H-3-7-4) TaxID=983544 RepID=UPI00020A3940|nr:carboxypeptidase regulatory-like domain-containing protein [Lacinutrix sp. 5H-3-7-4]AEH00139.1 fibronectin, type III domain-containing protein [Lacinutrix sp. 5H-3-7-4]
MKTLKYLAMFFVCMLLLTCSENQIDGERIGSINGKVVAEGTNAPLENVKISTNSPTSTVFTDNEGNFVIENAPIGTYAVQAELDGFVTAFESVTVIEDAAAVVSFEMLTSNANNQPPSIPTLIFPEDLATEQPLEMQFTWEASDLDINDELSYTLELRNGNTNEIEIFETAQDTFYLASNLQLSTTYFWQVKVSDNTNEEVTSSISQFSTITSPNNPFLFVKEEDGNSVIYSGNQDDSTTGNGDVDVGILKLTSETNNSFRPRANMAINKIAYLRTTGGNAQIFTMNTDGSNKTQVTNAIPVTGFRFDHIDFCWAQNGSKLYYPNFNELYSINPDGSGAILIYETVDGSFISEVETVASDNDLVLLKTNNANGYNARIFTLRLSTQTEETVIAEGFNGALGGIDISANGNQVVYTRDLSGYEQPDYRQFQSRIFFYDINLGTNTQIVTEALPGQNDLDVKFSPTEGGFVFTRVDNNLGAVPGVRSFQLGQATAEKELFTAASMPDWD